MTPGRSPEPALDDLLAEQLRYYRERAATYGQEAPVPASVAEVTALRRALTAAFDVHFRGGEVLELACGPGSWTGMLAERAASVTAIDGAPEMLALAADAVAGAGFRNVAFAQADLFAWRPDRRYDAVFFGFWLSHVPEERFDAFWATVDAALAPGGHVVFVDDAYRTADELVYGADSEVIQRTQTAAAGHRIVKAVRTAEGLRARLAELGWRFEVGEEGQFFWGVGQRSPSK